MLFYRLLDGLFTRVRTHSLATNRVNFIRELLCDIAHLGAKVGDGVTERLRRRRVRVGVHLEHDSVVRRVRVLVPGKHHVRVFMQLPTRVKEETHTHVSHIVPIIARRVIKPSVRRTYIRNKLPSV